MTSDNRLEAAALKLFDEALKQPSDSRKAWIIAQTEGDPALRARALALVAADKSTSSLVTGGALDHFDTEETPPESIGAYRVIGLLGRGGMGVVWLGERASGDFDHRVAIKVVRGLARSPRLAERLRYERQTLASLQHPNIAQLYDGGETAAGEPYFIMEYVPGAPLADALDRGLSKAERLAIFRAVCEAVEYAHQKLIVHRDLSLANILLADEGRVKLIDFGISRSFGEDGPGGSQKIPQMTMTKGFAAPERLKGEAASTLSDMYSLGVILKEMLAAAPAAGDADLSAIAAKAAAVQPEARYQSATALIDDLDRYAAGRAVEARGAGGLYALGKFVRRRRFAVGAATLAVAGVIGALAVTSVLYARAETERREADMRFAQVRELADYMLFDLYDQLEPVAGATKALSGIADKSREYLDALSQSARSSTALRLETALGYKRLGDVVGNPIGANLGRREEAGEHLARAFTQLEEMHEAAPADADIARGLAQTAFSMAVYQFIAIDDNEAAARYARRAEELYAAIIASGAGTDKDEMARIEAKAESAKPLSWMGKGEEAVATLEAARAAAAAFAASHPDDERALSLSASVHIALAEAMGRRYDMEGGGDYAAALPHIDHAIALYQEMDKGDPEDGSARRSLPSAYFKRALIFYSLDDDEKVYADLKQAEAIAQEILGQDPDDRGMTRTLQAVREQMAMTLAYLGRHDEAIAAGEATLAAQKEMLAAEPDNPARFREVTHLYYMVGEIYLVAERQTEACARFRESRNRWKIIETRWGVSDYDREDAIKPVETYLADCG